MKATSSRLRSDLDGFRTNFNKIHQQVQVRLKDFGQRHAQVGLLSELLLSSFPLAHAHKLACIDINRKR